MAIISCPECGGVVSTSAITCPHCGYGVSEHMQKLKEEEEQAKRQEEAHDEIQALLDKIIPCDFTIPEPRAKVCIKCGENPRYKERSRFFPKGSYSDSMCKHDGVEFPLVEIDYPQAQTPGNIGSRLYMQRYCIEPRNIGDQQCDEYGDRLNNMNRIRGFLYSAISDEDLLSPPDPAYFGKTLEDEPKPTPRPKINIPVNTNTPKCPTCGSTNISKISTATRAAHGFAFGLFSNTARSQFKCNACGYKW